MNPTRRHFMTALAGSAFAVSAAIAAEPFPSRIMTLVVPYATGGPTDAMARTLASEGSGLSAIHWARVWPSMYSIAT